ncbi:MAG: hypothetical protein NXI12_08015 [Alphaproteobacteria bacterium]|nr:hypothetical protein [Alphaproteobacteria bacterium]
MARRNSTGPVLGVILAALCFAAALFLFQAHAAAGDSALYIAQSVSSAR